MLCKHWIWFELIGFVVRVNSVKGNRLHIQQDISHSQPPPLFTPTLFFYLTRGQNVETCARHFPLLFLWSAVIKRLSFPSTSYVISIMFGRTVSFSCLDIWVIWFCPYFDKIRAREKGWYIYIYLKNLSIDFLALVFEIFHICGYGLSPLLPPSSSPFWHSQRSFEKFLPSSILSLTSPLSHHSR